MSTLKFKKKGTLAGEYTVHRQEIEIGYVQKEGPKKWWGYYEDKVKYGPFPSRGEAAKILHFHHVCKKKGLVELTKPGWTFFVDVDPSEGDYGEV